MATISKHLKWNLAEIFAFQKIVEAEPTCTEKVIDLMFHDYLFLVQVYKNFVLGSIYTGTSFLDLFI